ncbi:hypothetical protein PENTCL1PPCAC_12176 [Pristionchus entomophagus]|uniref:CWH43-like N-terminal domain-containing protein n=1 Tax=Pristionchus entomophagus TaxID=358040 RepID=A0AAV5T3B8_9BILA|nr:hypothetical protein PENTCL1PPCAC_12176 [Pristionchus entomophagus]
MTEIKKLWILPIFTSLFCLIGIVVPYAIGAADGNIPAILPFISDGGAYAPEKSIFSLFQNISAALVIITAYVKHLQFATYYECRRLDSYWRPLSIVTMIFAFFTAVGLCVVGNFSEMEELDVHDIGALVTFFSAILYLSFTAGLSFLRPLLCSPPVAFLRVGLAVLATIALFFHECTLQFNIFVPAGTNETEYIGGYVPEFLTPDSPFYVNHIVATGTEWLLAFIIFSYFITFVEEFRKASLSLPSINFHVDRSSSFRRQQTEESWKL